MKLKFSAVIITLLGILFGSTMITRTVGVPLPADTIQGLYYPFKDIPTAYSNGVPYKNALITDPIRQQFPWKYETIHQLKSGEWPLWNPYNFSGTPLLANIQSGALYPLNAVFFIPYLGLQSHGSELSEFTYAWALYIHLQSILGCYFMYLYLKKIGLTQASAIFGSLAWIFSGYMTAWWEWGNIGHTIIWMPLLFWSIEKYTEEIPHAKIWQIPYALWIFCFGLCASFLAGHWQSFSFVVINTFFYALYRLAPKFTARRRKQWAQIVIMSVLAATVTAAQWMPSLEFIQKSAREIDPTQWQRLDWFFPNPHLIGLIAPDFFGNPSTQNYWGVWNYGEFASYVGILPLLFAISISLRWLFQQTENKEKHKNTLDVTERNIGVGFFLFCILINGVLITRNPLSQIPYQLNLPFIGTTQPSRGIVMIDFALAVLAAVGLQYFVKNLQKRITKPMREKDKNDRNTIMIIASVGLLSTLGLGWLLVLTQTTLFPSIVSDHSVNSVQVARNNLVLPTILTLIITCIFVTIKAIISKRAIQYLSPAILHRSITLLPLICIVIASADLLRFFTKFNTFTSLQHVYPTTPISQDLQGRYMTDDARIMAPNINLAYRLASADGYDPLYFAHYGKYIGMWVRNRPDLTPYPANRILTPHNYDQHLADIAAVSHLYSFDPDLAKEQISLDPIKSYGSITLYQRLTSLNYLGLLTNYHSSPDEQTVANDLFQLDSLWHAVILSTQDISNTSTEEYKSADALQIRYQTPNRLNVTVNNPHYSNSLLYRAESYDNNWQIRLDNLPTPLHRTNFSFQGVVIPSGIHTVEFRYDPPSFHIGKTITLIGIIISITLLIVSKVDRRNLNSS